MERTLSRLVCRWVYVLGVAALSFSVNAAVITDLSYDLAALSEAEFLNDWTETSSGPSASKTGINIQSVGDSLVYTQNGLDMSHGEAFLFDAVVSGSGLAAADGDLGAKMWVHFGVNGMPPSTAYRAEVRFVKEASVYKINLVDGSSGVMRASLTAGWPTTVPRQRVRLRRQLVGGVDTIIFQVEDENLWDNELLNPLVVDATNTISIPVVGNFAGAGSLGTPFGFGNANAGTGNYYSEWETLRFIHSSEPDTLLPPVSEDQIVTIDVKPGSDPNCFNINGHGVIPVAILGSDDFDVTNIDPLSLSFGGLQVRVRGKKGPLCSVDYSDSDAYLDLICHFEDDASNWEAGAETVLLTGSLFDETEFLGEDSICIVH